LFCLTPLAVIEKGRMIIHPALLETSPL
jgi:hypothetical protein